jgi:hypothetical protein
LHEWFIDNGAVTVIKTDSIVWAPIGGQIGPWAFIIRQFLKWFGVDIRKYPLGIGGVKGK